MEGATFTQMRGGEFTYEIRGTTLVPDRTDRHFSYKELQEANSRKPYKGVGDLQDLNGPSYLYAILTDKRVDPDY